MMATLKLQFACSEEYGWTWLAKILLTALGALEDSTKKTDWGGSEGVFYIAMGLFDTDIDFD